MDSDGDIHILFVLAPISFGLMKMLFALLWLQPAIKCKRGANKSGHSSTSSSRYHISHAFSHVTHFLGFIFDPRPFFPLFPTFYHIITSQNVDDRNRRKLDNSIVAIVHIEGSGGRATPSLQNKRPQTTVTCLCPFSRSFDLIVILLQRRWWACCKVYLSFWHREGKEYNWNVCQEEEMCKTRSRWHVCWLSWEGSLWTCTSRADGLGTAHTTTPSVVSWEVVVDNICHRVLWQTCMCLEKIFRSSYK